MLVRDVKEIGRFNFAHEFGRQLIVTWKDKPRCPECGHKPRVAHNGARVCLNQDSGVADRCGLHGVLRNRWIGELFATASNMFCPLTAIPVAKLEAVRWVGVPRGGCC